jgi:ribonuclease HI
MKKVDLYTDGACLYNPGPGGWGAVLRYGSHEKRISGGERATTNNRMELTAAIKGLSLLKEPCSVTLYSDSSYLVNAIEKGWLSSWQKNGWRTAAKKPVLNEDLWRELIPLLDMHDVSFVWVKGHAGHEMNELCDAMASAEAQKMLRENEASP